MSEPGFFKVIWDAISTSPWERHRRVQERAWKKFKEDTAPAQSLLMRHHFKEPRIKLTLVDNQDKEFAEMRQTLATATQAEMLKHYNGAEPGLTR
jgi:hypothetical protein